MFEDHETISEADYQALSALLSESAPKDSARAFAELPAKLLAGDTPDSIEARIDLALLCAREGLLNSALYQVDELTKDARRVSDLNKELESTLVSRADQCRNLIEAAANNSRS